MSDADHVIETEEQLRAVIGDVAPGVELKIYDHVNERAREYIGRSPFVVMATADADGHLDSSPKGDAPGFVEVVDEHTLLVPDRPGNKLIYGHLNILGNGRIGLLFVVPGTNETLRVNGRAQLTNDPALLTHLQSRGKPAVLAIEVAVEECFFHCGKAFIRSHLWKPDSWPASEKVSFGEMVVQRIHSEDPALAQTIDDMIEEDYRANL